MSSYCERNRLLLHLVGAAAVAHCCTVLGEDGRGPLNWLVHRPDRAWLQPYDPTLLAPRFLTQFEHEDREAGDASAKWTLNQRWACSIGKGLALGLQVEVPFRWVDEAGRDDAGMGDLEARAAIVGHLHDNSRWGMALNARFPTAADDLLGDGVLELRPIAAVRWEVASRLELGANLEYSFTPRDEGDSRISALELKLPMAVKLADSLSGFTSYNPRWDDVGGTWRHRLEFGLTRQFGTRRQYAIALGGEIPLSDERLEWKGSLGFTCYLQ